jgi:glycosyltransferase involved in cell wall biosynthesis
VRLTLIGPMPPPIHGQSMVTHRMVSELARHFTQMRIADTSEGEAIWWLRPFTKLRRTAVAWWSIWGSDAVYISVNNRRGMWLTTAAAGLARLAGARVFLHHHSYSYVRARQLRMVALTRAAGPQAHHIVLSRSMASDLTKVMPEIRRVLIIGNAALVDRALLQLPLKTDGSGIVLGHLSNLSRGKGIAEVIDLALALHRAEIPMRLLVGGPTVGEGSHLHLDRAARELGAQFEYRGPLSGEAKSAFFNEITHFVFPSRLTEAVPLVLYEAMAAGALCIATSQGSIPEQLEGSPGVLAQSADSFVEETLPVLVGASVSTAASHESRQVYERALAESERQLESFVTLLAGDDKARRLRRP